VHRHYCTEGRQLLIALAPTVIDQLFVQSRDLCLSHLHSTPPSGGPRWNIAITFSMEKLEWFDYPMVKKFEEMFTHFDRIHERDGQTDGWTPHDDMGHACIASSDKNCFGGCEDRHISGCGYFGKVCLLVCFAESAKSR